MRRDTRGAILDTAREQFNRRGYNSVSMGDIAEAVGISKGNLTYHFKKKLDMIEALVSEMHQSYQPPEIPQDLQALNAWFTRINRHICQNGYYFWHYDQLAQLSPGIRALQENVIRDRYRIFSAAFRGFVEQGWMRPEEYPGQHEITTQAVLTVCIYWMPHSRITKGFRQPGTFLECMWSPIFPLLTEEGKRVYLQQIQKPHKEEH